MLAGKQLGFSKKLQAEWASKKVVLQLFHPGGHVGFHFQFPPEEGTQLFFSFFSILSFWQQKLSSLTSIRQELLVIMLHFCGGASVPSGARRKFCVGCLELGFLKELAFSDSFSGDDSEKKPAHFFNEFVMIDLAVALYFFIYPGR